jgi:hypothetical protein
VANRLKRFNGISATPLYHPPFSAERFFTAPAENYIYAPSAGGGEAPGCAHPSDGACDQSRRRRALGDGGQRAKLEALAAEMEVTSRVHFLGHVNRR